MGRKGRPLTVAQILAWADDHEERTGSWPRITSGAVLAPTDESWRAIDIALRQGLRGLPGGGSLPRLLASEHGCP
jgi:hypothetical protein